MVRPSLKYQDLAKRNLDSDAKELVKRLGGLPLALATAGVYIQRNKCTFKHYLKEYKNHWVFNSNSHIKFPEYGKSLHTAWDQSYERLKSYSPKAARLLGMLAYFDNPKIRHELIPAGEGNKPDYWRHQMKTNDEKTQPLMGTLADFGFLDSERNDEIERAPQWSMHNCVHAWTLAVLNREVNPEFHWYAFDCVAS